ncbi:MAG: type II toxin-antitoxin system VapC family toxin [Solirubrobacteraceae bacterium]
MSPVLFDTAIFVYAAGAESPHRDPCRALLELAGAGSVSAVVSADLLQEFVHQRARKTGDRHLAVAQAHEIPGTCEVLDLTLQDAERALEVFEAHPELHARDAVFAAVALERDIRHVVSPDRAFDAVPGLVRVDPLDAAAVAALGV